MIAHFSSYFLTNFLPWYGHFYTCRNFFLYFSIVNSNFPPSLWHSRKFIAASFCDFCSHLSAAKVSLRDFIGVALEFSGEENK